MGLRQSRQALLDETHLTEEFEICDNIDLDTIYQEYCSYYLLKFGKQPKVVKKNEAYNTQSSPALPQRKQSGCKKRTPNPPPVVKPQSLSPRGEPEANNDIRKLGANLMVSQLIDPNHATPPSAKEVSEPMGKKREVSSSLCTPSTRPLISLHENYSSEWKELADIVCRYYDGVISIGASMKIFSLIETSSERIFTNVGIK